jgi:predicted RNase H-like nuclease (RuvC/YqgF family)
LSDKIRKTNFNEESKSKLLFKEKNIKHLNRELYNKDINIVLLKKRIKRFEGILSKWNGIVILKKLDNFGSSEFNRKKEFLNIKKEDILLLNNPDIISDHVIDFLKEKVSVVIAKTDVSKKIRERCPFIFLKYSDLNIQEDEFFAVVSKVELNQKLKSKETINQIVQNYKKQRTASLTNL